LYRARGKGGWLGTAFLVQYWIFFFLLILPAGLGLWAIEYLDRERRLPPVVLGDRAAEKEIAVVYHPGGSRFTGDVLRHLGERLGEAGYKVTLYSAHRDLRVDLGKAAAVGLASPVYASSIRPPLQRFIAASDFSGRRCFVLLTGGGPEGKEKDLESVVPSIEARGGRVVAVTKIVQAKEEARVEEQIRGFARDLLAALEG
ncbi:MAG: hypothetical protein K6U03_04160, partial [Firmicutes bacterium]|nr:hypothetical protein [Bacillota bacterium]